MRAKSVEFDYPSDLVCPPNMVADSIVAEWRRARRIKRTSINAHPEPLTRDEGKRAHLMDAARLGDSNAIQVLEKKYKLRLVQHAS